MSITSQSVRQNIEVKKMKDSIIKSMTSEELSQFKADAQQSKLKAELTKDRNAMESFISLKAKQLQPRIVAQEI